MGDNKLIECQGSAVSAAAGSETDGCCIINTVKNGALTSRSNKVEVTLVSHRR